MIKILKMGKVMITKCPNCGCKFSCEKEDIMWGDQQDSFKAVNCPCCEKLVNLSKQNLYQEAARDNTLKKEYKVGDELIITDIDGEAVYVVAHLKDDKAYMVRKWLLGNSNKIPLLTDDFNVFDWLNGEYRESLPKDIREMIVGNITLPSEMEVFGKMNVA